MIPKKIHQIWLGDQKKRPQNLINSWKYKNPDWDHFLWTEENLPIQEVYFLAFIDSDGNSDPENTNPDSKDPVTLPSDNDFDVIGGEVTEVTVLFAMLYP